MEYKIARQEFAPQPVLVIRRRVRRAEIAAAIGAALPKVFLHAQQRGWAIAGYPITRYLETSVGLVTLETGMRVTAHSGDWTAADGAGEFWPKRCLAGRPRLRFISDRTINSKTPTPQWRSGLLRTNFARAERHGRHT